MLFDRTANISISNLLLVFPIPLLFNDSLGHIPVRRCDYICVLQTAHQEISKLSVSVDVLDKKVERIAEFFCEDKQKFEVEKLLKLLLQFVEQLPALAKVYSNHACLLYMQ